MPLAPSNRRQVARRKRELRREIARLRRRVDADVKRLAGETTRLSSWRTYVRRFPLPAAVAAVGFGFLAAAGLRRGAWTRLAGRKLINLALEPVKAGLWQDLLHVWSAATPGGEDAPTSSD